MRTVLEEKCLVDVEELQHILDNMDLDKCTITANFKEGNPILITIKV